MSPHHSDQMSQRSHVSRVALCKSKVKVLWVSESVSQWVSEWQGHLLSCSGQLKMEVKMRFTPPSKQTKSLTDVLTALHLKPRSRAMTEKLKVRSGHPIGSAKSWGPRPILLFKQLFLKSQVIMETRRPSANSSTSAPTMATVVW